MTDQPEECLCDRCTALCCRYFALGIDEPDTPEEFDDYTRAARAKGFAMVSSAPLTRSSYHADADFQRLVAARESALGGST